MIVQAKHWQSKSVAMAEIAANVASMDLMPPPVVRVLVFATSGAFTLDAIEWAERHDDRSTAPYIELWPHSRLEMLLARGRPSLLHTVCARRSTEDLAVCCCRVALRRWSIAQGDHDEVSAGAPPAVDPARSARLPDYRLAPAAFAMASQSCV